MGSDLPGLQHQATMEPLKGLKRLPESGKNEQSPLGRGARNRRPTSKVSIPHHIPHQAAGSVRQAPSRGDFYALPVVYAPPACQHRFAELLKPLWSAQAANEAQGRTLAAVRDALLPKLISGELRIKDAAHLVVGHL